jgi:DNA adenine methylase
MKVPHPIPYQGSKRNIARYILPFFPRDIDTLMEPFAGSAAISIAAACYGKASRFHLNDINKPLMALWHEIVNDPEGVSTSYENLWREQQVDARSYYDWVRNEFNRIKRPDYLLYLLARCVKASVRYNPKGEFNQSPDNRRLGRNPQRMTEDIYAVSNLLRGRVRITCKDYGDVLRDSTERDLIYMDPPYQGVCSSGDPRYYAGVDFENFMQSLAFLNQRGIPFILSYDGRTGDKKFGQELPSDLNLYKIEVNAGRSSQATLLGENSITFESVYLSPTLLGRLEFHPHELVERVHVEDTHQLKLVMN